jgi:DNA integrity scanning protein DisA with diadenylate cyclase activity
MAKKTPADTINRLAKIFNKSSDRVAPEMKLRLAEIIVRMIGRRKEKFGLFVILGWQNRWSGFTDIADRQQDIFARHKINIMNDWRHGGSTAKIRRTINFDGAILIDAKGNITHSGVIIEGLHPRRVAKKLNPGNFSDLSAQFGFGEKVHARHLAAITASHMFKGTTVFTVSEESRSFHIFENGRILFTLRG